eukprot:351042-Chlamydomonas_euryale.AAC.3
MPEILWHVSTCSHLVVQASAVPISSNACPEAPGERLRRLMDIVTRLRLTHMDCSCNNVEVDSHGLQLPRLKRHQPNPPLARNTETQQRPRPPAIASTQKHQIEAMPRRALAMQSAHVEKRIQYATVSSA